MSKIADFIEQNRELLAQRFLEEAAALESARGLRPAELAGFLPDYLAALAALLREGPRPEPMAEKRRLEETHLGQRLRLGYTPRDTVDELVLLGRLITQQWAQLPPEAQPASSELQLLREALDAARAHAEEVFNGYSLEERQREKRDLRRLDALSSEVLERDARLPERLAPLLEVIQQALEAQGVELRLARDGGGPLERVAATGVLKAEEGGPYTRVEFRLMRHGGLLGVLIIGLAEARSLEPRARRSLETLAEHLSGTLERVRHLERERHRSEQLQGLARASVAIHAATSVDAVLGLITEQARHLIGAHQSVTSLTVDASWAQAINSVSLSDKYAAWRVYAAPTDGGGIYAWTAQRNRSVRMTQAELEAHPRWRGFGKHAATHPPMRGWLAAPLFMRDGKNVGLIQLSDKYEGEFNEDDEAILVQLAQVGSVAIENARLYTALHESEDRLRLAVTAAKLGTWDFNPETGVLRWDERCKELFGLPPDAEVTWDTFLTGLHPEDRARTEEAVQRALSGEDGGTYAIEYRTRGERNGAGYWVAAHGRAFFDERGRVVRFIGTVFDITARKQLGEALRESEAHLRRVVAATGVGSWELELDTQRVVADARLLELFWLPPDSPFTLERALGAIHPEDRDRVERAVAAAVAGENGGRYEEEYRTLSRDGRMRWVAASGQSFFDSSGKTVRFLGIGLDITGRKAAEEALRERSMLERQLIGIVSHDLRNPLNTILLGVQALLRRDDLDERITRTAVRIQQATERATRLVRDLLDFTQARLGGGLRLEREPVDLHELVQLVVDEVRAVHPERELLVASDGDGRGEWDGDRLSQLVTNLVTNAVKYSPAGTPITVMTIGDEHEVTLEVHNEGPPIPADVLPGLFQPLQRGEGSIGTAERSVGLGLYIVDQVVRAHRGSLAVSSSQAEGTSFTVRLPRSVPPVPER